MSQENFNNQDGRYAVVLSGGKQYVVKPGAKVVVDKLNAEVGSEITFSQVLLLNDGSKVDLATESTVTAQVVRHFKDKKVIIFKKRIRKGYTKKQGHRQERTELVVSAF